MFLPEDHDLSQPRRPDPLQILYRAPPGITFKQSDRWAADGIHKTKIDMKAWHNLVVAGGSVVHKCGLPTITENEMPADGLPLAPEWLVDLLVAQGHSYTEAELEAKRKAKERRKGVSGWRDDQEVNLSAYVEMAIDKFPAARGYRHDPTLRLVGKLCIHSLLISKSLKLVKLATPFRGPIHFDLGAGGGRVPIHLDLNPVQARFYPLQV